MNQPEVIATRLLKLEQQIIAYQKLHENEYSELWVALNTMKKDIAANFEENEDQMRPIGNKGVKELDEQKPKDLDT